MHMGTPIRRALLWLVFITLSIMAAAWMAMGAVAVQSGPGARPADDGGSIRVIKPASTNGTFVFEIECLPSGLTYAPEFPTDFTGANWESVNEIPDGDSCTVTETFPNNDAASWDVEHKVEANEPGSGQFQPGVTGVVPIQAPDTNTIRYKNTFVEPDPLQIKIVKIQSGGPATVFTFDVTCSMQGGPIGGGIIVEVPGDSMSDLIDIPFEYDECTVTEVFPTGGGDLWTTTYGQGQTPGREFSQQLNPQGVTEYVFENTFTPPRKATVTLTKVGPPLDFGFAVACHRISDEVGPSGVNGIGGVVLTGGTSDSETFEFRSEEDRFRCQIAEEALIGWTTTAMVAGAEFWDTGTINGSVAVAFVVAPGDDITVTYTNTAGYLAQPPTGIPPDVFTNDL